MESQGTPWFSFLGSTAEFWGQGLQYWGPGKPCVITDCFSTPKNATRPSVNMHTCSSTFMFYYFRASPFVRTTSEQNTCTRRKNKNAAILERVGSYCYVFFVSLRPNCSNVSTVLSCALKQHTNSFAKHAPGWNDDN